jgi:hypothetical protein
MRSIWSLNIDTVLEWYELLNEVQTALNREFTSEETERLFLEFMKCKGIKPSGNTELNKTEFINELVSKGQSILNIDKEGYKIIKPKDEK